jgi:hypothetical protein
VRRPGPGRPRTLGLWPALDALLYVARSGCPSAETSAPVSALDGDAVLLPKLTYERTWEPVNRRLVEQAPEQRARHAQPTAAIIDSQSVKTTEAGEELGCDVRKKLVGRNRHHLLLLKRLRSQRDADPPSARKAGRSFPNAIKADSYLASNAEQSYVKDDLMHIKYRFRNAMRSMGYSFTRYSPEHSLDGLLDMLFRHLNINCVLDVGANTGIYGSWLRNNGYQGYLISFEPVSRSFRELQQRAARDPKWKVHNMALGSVTGTMDINVTRQSTLYIILIQTAAPGA